MIYTYRVPFSHDSKTARAAFLEFVSLVRNTLGASDPDLRVVAEPIFSYGRRNADSWNTLNALLAKGGSAVIYLNDIEYYATVLVSTSRSLIVPGCEPFSSYESFEGLIKNPRMVGYGLPKDFIDQFVVPESYVVIGQLMYASYDYLTDEPNSDWYHVIREARPKHAIGPVHTYRIRNSSKCLELIVGSDAPTYFLPELDGLDIDACLSRYNQYKNDLTDYLLAHEVPFATINDGHQDDSFAVSYYRDIWRLGDSFRAFIA
jgi:hypothetical protein